MLEEKIKKALYNSRLAGNDPVVLNPENNSITVVLPELAKTLASYNYNQCTLWLPASMVENNPAYKIKPNAFSPTLEFFGTTDIRKVYNAADVEGFDYKLPPRPIEIKAANQNNHKEINAFIEQKQMRLVHSLYKNDPHPAYYDLQTNTGYLKHPSQYANSIEHYGEVFKLLTTASCYKLVPYVSSLQQIFNDGLDIFATEKRSVGKKYLAAMSCELAIEKLGQFGIPKKKYFFEINVIANQKIKLLERANKIGPKNKDHIESYSSFSSRYKNLIQDVLDTQTLDFQPDNLPARRQKELSTDYFISAKQITNNQHNELKPRVIKKARY